MQRVTIVLDDELLSAIDRIAAARGYQNRSEAVRDLARAGIRQASEDTEFGGDCLAALVYIYDHEERSLAKRLAKSIHDHHHLSVATLQVPLDHDSRMEVAVLRGNARKVRDFGEKVIAERGVLHGRLMTMPVEVRSETHAHDGPAGEKHLHVHVRKAG